MNAYMYNAMSVDHGDDFPSNLDTRSEIDRDEFSLH